MSKTALITGITGQDGFYLASYLLNKGYVVVGVKRTTSVPNDARIKLLMPHQNLFIVNGDITDAFSIQRIMEQYQPDEFYHLAAQSHVGKSFKIPKATQDINCGGTLNCLEAVRSIKPDCKFLFAACYDKDTKIVTRDGIKTYNEVNVGDLIYTVNIKSNKMELKPIKKIMLYNYNDKMIHINGKRINLSITPNHKVLLMNNKNHELFYEEADQISRRIKYDNYSCLSLPLPRWEGRTDQYINFDDFIDKDDISYNTVKNLIWKMETKDFLYLLGLYIGDGYTGKYKYKRSISNKDFIKRKDKLGRFIKSNQKRKQKTYDNNCIHYAIPKIDPSRQKLKKILCKYNIDFNDDNDMFLWFSSATLQKMFKYSGKNVYEKLIPLWSLEYSVDSLEYLYNGLIDSDGHWRSQQTEEYSTVSSKLLSGFIELCTKLGYHINIRTQEAKKIFFKKENRFFNSKKHYRIDISHKRRKNVYKHHISYKQYNGVIWCLEMEDNHNFMVERNGKICFCGNSSEMFGDQLNVSQSIEREYLTLNENSPLIARSPYGASKIYGFNLTRSYRESYNIFACNSICFNHESPLRGEHFVTRKITKGIADIVHGRADKIILGNIDACRDFGFAGDYVRAMHMIVNHEQPDNFVIAVRQSYSVRDFLDLAFNVAELGDYQKYIEINKEFYRPSDIEILLGNPDKATNILGWAPQVSFEKLVKLMVRYDIEEDPIQKRILIHDALSLQKGDE